MRLYVCWGTFESAPRPGGHPCGKAHAALKDAGYDPEVVHARGLSPLPDALFNRSEGRREVKRLTGKSTVPVLVLDDGQVITESADIIAWARQHPPGR